MARGAESLSSWIVLARCDGDKWPSSPFLGHHTLQGCKCNTAKMAELLLIQPCGDIWPFASSPESLFKRVVQPQPHTRGPTPTWTKVKGEAAVCVLHIVHGGSKHKAAAATVAETEVCHLFWPSRDAITRLCRQTSPFCSVGKTPNTPSHPLPNTTSVYITVDEDGLELQ